MADLPPVAGMSEGVVFITTRWSVERERPYNDFFLAMTYARLGEMPVAEMYLRRALAPLGQGPIEDTDLARLRDEAMATVRGVAAQPRN